MASRTTLKEDLTCYVCRDLYKDPVILSCTHNVCKACLQQFWESEGSRECPYCRRKCSRDIYPFNMALKNQCETFLRETSQKASARSGELCSLHREKQPVMAQQEDVSALLNDSGDVSMDSTIARARETVDRLDNVVLNIAITGVTGAGKSTLVNALRGLGDTDEGAAYTGVVETTKEVKAYPHPTMPNVKIWDLPGIRSTHFKTTTYLKDVNFDIYDFFIIVNRERFVEEDMMLAKEINRREKKFYFVRTMIDQDICAAARRGWTEEQTLCKIREHCMTHLQALTHPSIFLISSFYLEKYDFPELLNALERDLPQHKMDALVLSLPIYSLRCLERKYNTFKTSVWALAAASGGIAAVPIPGVSSACDVAFVLSFFTKCYHSFGLNDKSLTKLGERVNKPILDMVRESALVRAIADKTFLSTTMAVKLGAAGIVKGICSLIPVAGTIAAVGVSYATTRSVLQEGLNELYKVAKQVIAMAELK